MKRFKWLIERNDGGVWGNDPDGINDTVVLRSTEQSVDGRWEIDQPAKRRLTQKERESAALVINDLVITKSSGSSLHIGKTTLVDERIAAIGACYSNFMQRIRVGTAASPKVAWYILNNGLAREQLDLLSNSTTGLANLNGTMIGDLVLAVAPPAEQSAIAAALDRETARIDALISRKTRFIELLKEKRQALITHAVTKGLDPSVKMKDSGVEWIGEVPEHWRVVRLKHVLAAPLQYGANESGEENDDSGIRYIRITDLDEIGELRSDSVKRLPADIAAPYLLNDGDVLFARSGATVGKTYQHKASNGLACFAGYLIRARPDFDVALSEFVTHAVRSHYYWAYILQTTIQATIENVSAEKYGDFPLALPPVSEQQEVVTQVDAATSRIDSLVAKSLRSITLLKERRSALITAAVTGQIDLREAATANAAAPT